MLPLFLRPFLLLCVRSFYLYIRFYFVADRAYLIFGEMDVISERLVSIMNILHGIVDLCLQTSVSSFNLVDLFLPFHPLPILKDKKRTKKIELWCLVEC